MQNKNKRLILLINDDMLILKLLSGVLLQAGYEVRMALSSEMALDMIAESEREPDLALLSLDMPDDSGLRLAQHLESATTIPIMFLSSGDEDDKLALVAEHGAVGYLIKPINSAHICPSIKAALARADDIRQLRHTKDRLTAALRSGRETGMAVGLLMERYKTDRDTAFQALRNYARSHQSKVTEVATELLAAAEKLNAFAECVSRQAPQR